MRNSLRCREIIKSVATPRPVSPVLQGLYSYVYGGNDAIELVKKVAYMKQRIPYVPTDDRRLSIVLLRNISNKQPLNEDVNTLHSYAY